MSEVLFIAIYVASVFISALAQILLKVSANRHHDSVAKEYLNPFVIGGYLIFFLSTLVTIYAYKEVPLSLGPVIESLGYVFVGILSYLLLKEKITKRAFLGMALIVCGVIVFAL